MDITKYDEGIDAIVSCMNYPENPDERRAFLIRFITLAIQEM